MDHLQDSIGVTEEEFLTKGKSKNVRERAVKKFKLPRSPKGWKRILGYFEPYIKFESNNGVELTFIYDVDFNDKKVGFVVMVGYRHKCKTFKRSFKNDKEVIGFMFDFMKENENDKKLIRRLLDSIPMEVWKK